MGICSNCGRTVDDRSPCTACPEEPRGSRMPEHMPSIDPLFAHAVFNEFTPDERALLEKAGGGR